jgi:predicted metal-dependent phosphoesterase TrpH
VQDAEMTIEPIIDDAVAAGVSIVAITDHNTDQSVVAP